MNTDNTFKIVLIMSRKVLVFVLTGGYFDVLLTAVGFHVPHIKSLLKLYFIDIYLSILYYYWLNRRRYRRVTGAFTVV